MAQEKPILLPKKKEKKTDLPDSVEGWVDFVSNRHQEGLEDRKRFELQWVVNTCYFLGYQNIAYYPKWGRIDINQSDVTPLTINRIASFVEARHAKLNKHSPVPRTIPNTNETDDTFGAKTADKALLHLWRKLELDEEYDTLSMLMLQMGNAFMKTVWDPLAGDVIDGSALKLLKTDKNKNLVFENDEIAEEEIFLGEIACSAMSPFQIVPANSAILRMKDQPYIIERNHLPLIEAERLYPHLRGKISREDPETIRTEYERVIDRLASSHFRVSPLKGKSHQSVQDEVLVKTLWLKPNHVYENGVACVTIGKECAMLGEWPNNYGKKNIYPIVKFSEKNDGLHFWNQATVERLIPIQRTYNRIRQQKAKNIALMCNIKWLNPKGSQVIETALSDEEGEVIDYNPAAGAPKPAEIQGMPAYAMQFAQELITDFRDVGGQRESSITPPANLTAGVAISVAAELADEIVQPIIKRFARSMGLVANIKLELIDQEYREERMIKIVGEGDKHEIQWFKSTDLRHNTDVHIEIESMIPEFRGAKRQTLLDFWDRQIVQDPKKLLRSFRYGSFDELLEEEEMIEQQIMLDIESIKKGREPEIHPFQNHLLYVAQYSKFAQTPQFMALEPDRKQLLLSHLQGHLGFLAQQLPQGGAAQTQTNPAAVGSPFGPIVPAAQSP